ncbi:FIG004556: membrane metalloprotease [hydrothermal vent metagenome]|uniref:FIG004556: membrane metalloprotease n=1 Tax=hydrothermal vent metagenome TaxID=652676 RepID=A0A3B0ZIQ6_9ZZZZ
MEELSLLQRIAVWTMPVILAITVHEVAHGWVALKLGDSTAKMLGRLTLNPVKHIDPIGTLLVPGLLLVMGGFIFGWAKPVPVTWENLRKPKRDMALVALAGPLSNLLMALMWAGILKIGLLLAIAGSAEMVALPLIYMGGAGITINLILMVLNLLPMPPLDGGRIVASLLPDKLSWQFNRLERWGFVILLGLMVMGVLGKILWPPINYLQSQIFILFGL